MLTGAEILRLGLGLEQAPFGGKVALGGTGWAHGAVRACPGHPAAPVTRARRASTASCGATRPRRCRGSGSWTPPGSGAAWRFDMGLGKTPTVLAHLGRSVGDGPALVIAPPAVVGQLGRGVGPLHPRPPGGGAPRRLPRHGRRAGGRGRRSRRRHHDLRHRGARRRRAGRAALGPHRPRRGAGHQEPGQRDGPAAPSPPGPHPRRPHRHPHRERPRRPLGAARLHQPGPRRRPPRLRRPDGRRGRGRAAGAQRHPRVPPHQERARSSRPSCPTASTSSTTAR